MEGKMNCKWHLQILWSLVVLIIIKFILPQAILYVLPNEQCQSLPFTFIAIVPLFCYPSIFQTLLILIPQAYCPFLQERWQPWLRIFISTYIKFIYIYTIIENLIL